jgi:hypothetical protein
MAYYLIHTCNQRFWYVKEYLIPSMMLQGIPADNIFVYRDYNEIGNLRAFIDSCNKNVQQCEKNGISGVWHLQDDIIVSNDFAQKTQLYDNGLVCGFTCAYDKQPEEGFFQLYQQKMWYSFPCMRIPTSVLRAFVDWANVNLWQSKYFKSWVKRNKADDMIFKEWLYDNYPDMTHHNLAPNIVNHIDKYLGGSVVNTQRDKDQDTMSIFWEDNGELQNVMKFLLDRKQNI